MSHEIEFLRDLAIVMVVAGLTTVIFHKLKQPVVLGYILAGFVIGPFTPPFPLITNEHTVKALAELGVIFLMFRMGLHFSLRKLLKVGLTAVIAAFFEIVAMVWIGYEIGQFFDWSTMDSLFLGAILSISSTTIIAKALTDLKLSHHPFAELIFGILIVEDILGVVLLTLLSSIAMSGDLNVASVAKVSLNFAVFLVFVLVGGLLLVPRILKFISSFRDSEMLLVGVLGMCFGVALLAAELGYSVALGAFLIGAVMAETREAGMIEKVIVPLRDMFSAIFFVAVGMLINPTLLSTYLVPIIVITVAVILGKIITCTAGTFLAGNDGRTSLKVGLGLAQIGEFSFIIAQLGVTLNVTSEFIYPLAVSVSALTTITTPYLIRGSDGISQVLESNSPPWIINNAKSYTAWFRRVIGTSAGNAAQRQLLSYALQLVLNLLLVAGLIIIAVTGATKYGADLDEIPNWIGGVRGAAWFAAMLLSLPLILSSIRKIGQLSYFLTRTNGPGSGSESFPASANTTHLRRVIFSIGCSGLFIWVFILSATIIPELPVFLTLLGILLVVTIFTRPRLINVYASGKYNLVSAFTNESKEVPPIEEKESAVILQGSELLSVVITAEASAVGRLIREVHLRSTTGALVVAIDRHNERIANPGPDEEFKVGDLVVLLGNRSQVEMGKKALLTSLAD